MTNLHLNDVKFKKKCMILLYIKMFKMRHPQCLQDGIRLNED